MQNVLVPQIHTIWYWKNGKGQLPNTIVLSQMRCNNIHPFEYVLTVQSSPKEMSTNKLILENSLQEHCNYICPYTMVEYTFDIITWRKNCIKPMIGLELVSGEL